MSITFSAKETVKLILDEYILAAEKLIEIPKFENFVHGYAAQVLLCCAYEAIGRVNIGMKAIGSHYIHTCVQESLDETATEDFYDSVRGKLIHNAAIGGHIKIRVGSSGDVPISSIGGKVTICNLRAQIDLLRRLLANISDEKFSHSCEHVESLIGYRGETSFSLNDEPTSPQAVSGYVVPEHRISSRRKKK